MHINNNKLNKHGKYKHGKPVGHDKAKKRSGKLPSINFLDIHTLNSMLYKLKLQKRIKVGHINRKVDQAEREELGTHKNILTQYFRFSRLNFLVHSQPCASPKPN